MNKKKLIAWLSFIVWLLVIFFFSNQNGEASSSLSGGILNSLKAVIPLPISMETYSLLEN